MASSCSCQTKVLNIRVNLSSVELAEMENALRSEYGPAVVSPERAEELKGILKLADKDIREHDSEIIRIQNELMLVQAQKERLETQRAQLRALLSPMRRLSNEILLNIFEHACEENILQSYPWLSDEKPPTKFTTPAITYLPTMAISSVCYRWREVALSSPILWANLVVEIYTATPDQAQTQDGFIVTVVRYLLRSGNWPLSLTLDIRGPVLIAYQKTVLSSLAYLTRHAQRWKKFEYRGSHSFEDHKILSQLQFPSLVELELSGPNRGVDSLVLDRFEHSPRLSALYTNQVPVSKVPYDQLNHLGLSMGSAVSKELAEALRSCPSVNSLTLDSGHQQSEHLSQQGAWRNITSLAVQEKIDRLCLAEMVLLSFDFPSLNVLHVKRPQNAKEPTAWPGDVFLSFVSRSSCVLTTFTLCGLALSDLDLIAALRVMPFLLHLEIDDAFSRRRNQRSPITSHLISSLQHQSKSTSLVPKLHSLRLASQLSQTFDDHGFIRMIQSRWFQRGSALSAAMLAIGKTSIRSVVLKFGWREVDADVYEPLRILDEAGLRVVISGTNGVQV